MNYPAEPSLFQAEPACRDLRDRGDHGDHSAAADRLRAAIDAAFDACTTPADPSRCPAFARALRTALGAALTEPMLVTAAEREGCAATYRRHLIAIDPQGRYTVAALVWRPGQASPVHAHHTWCGYAVLEGTLTETLYAWDAERGGAEALRAQPRAPGAMAFGGRGRGGIHRLSNDSGHPAISLHIYGVPAAQIGTHVNDVLPLLVGAA
jgi:predicted metal-dependent enzyme (double-stranded beta helix superfamily)